MNLLKNPRERRRMAQFAFVGTLGAGVDFSVYNLLALALHLPPVIASVLSFMAAVTHNFLWHRHWTFSDSRSKPVTQQMTQFVIVNVLGISIRTPIFILLSALFLSALRRVSSLPFNPDTLAHNLALAGAIGIIMFWNFFVNRFWTYNDV